MDAVEYNGVFIRTFLRAGDGTCDAVLTIKEGAALFKLTEKTIYAMANAGEISAFEIREQWRIKRVDLDKWLHKQPRGGDGGGLGE